MYPAPDHHQMLRHLLKGQSADIVYDHLVIDGDAGDLSHFAAGRQKDVLAFDHAGVLAGDFNLLQPVGSGSQQPATPLDPAHLVLFEQKSDTAGKIADDAFLARHHFGQVQLGRGNFDAVHVEFIARQSEVLARIEQRLARDTTFIETNPSEGRTAFHDGDLHAQLCGANRAHISAGAGAQYNQIKNFISHLCSPYAAKTRFCPLFLMVAELFAPADRHDRRTVPAALKRPAKNPFSNRPP